MSNAIVPKPKLVTGLLAALVVMAGLWTIRGLEDVLAPLLVAWFLAQLLNPVVSALVRKRIPTGLAIGGVLGLLLLAIYGIGVFISSSTASFLRRLPEFQNKFRDIVRDISSQVPASLNGSGDEVPVSAEVSRLLSVYFNDLVQMAGGLFTLMTSLLSSLILILVILGFLLVGRASAFDKIRLAFRADTVDRVERIAGSISRQLSGYLIVQFAISLLTGLLVWGTCEAAGIVGAATWGAVAFFLNFVPIVGSIVAGIPPVLLALLQFYPSVMPAVWVGIAILAINQVLGNILTPKMMGDRLNLSPLVIIASLLLWAWLWGIVGVLLSVLIAMSIRVICENVDVLKPVAVLMSAGPPRRVRRERTANDTAESSGPAK